MMISLVAPALMAYFLAIPPNLPYQKVSIKGQQHRLYWTLDDHPNKHTFQILRWLKNKRIRATFFVLTYSLSLHKRWPKSRLGLLQLKRLKAIKAAGHVIGNHSHTHAYICRLGYRYLVREVHLPQHLLFQFLQLKPIYWRPPHGFSCPSLKAEVNKLGLTTVLWNVADWKQSPLSIWQQTLWRVRRGKDYTIMLWHSSLWKMDRFFYLLQQNP